MRFHASDIGGRGHGPPGTGLGQWARCGLLVRCFGAAAPGAGFLAGSMAFPEGITVEGAAAEKLWFGRAAESTLQGCGVRPLELAMPGRSSRNPLAHDRSGLANGKFA